MAKDINKKDVRTIVRERYGNLAQQSGSGSTVSCCAPESDCCGVGDDLGELPGSVVQLYEIDVAGLPADVTNLSLGCGDPVTLASLEPGQVVLDLGSGGGIDCFLAAKQVGPMGKVIGVDMTPAMIDRARINKEKIGAENVDFRLGEIEHLPVEDESVDVIISNCVINLSPNKPQVFRDAFRVLRPGGKLAVSDIVLNGSLPEEIKNSLSAWASCVAGAIDIKDYKAAIEAAGFENVHVQPIRLDESLTIEAVDGSGEEVQLDNGLNDSLAETIFSAKVTAFKPG